MSMLLLVLDLLGTFVFALSGGTAGARRRLDLFGVLVLAFVAGNVGGITRDLLIGSVPPAAVVDRRYLATSLLAGLVAFYGSPAVGKWNRRLLVLDAAGLGLFAVSGAQKALASGLNPAAAALLGMLTGIGGGMARDVLLAEVPIVLRADVYAVAALAGATTVVLGHAARTPATATAIAAALLCFGLRLAAIGRHWNLPPARSSDPPP